MKQTLLILLSAAIVLLQTPLHARTTLNDCPAPVKKTISENLKGGAIHFIDTDDVNGRIVYHVEIDLPGDRELELEVATNGNLLRTREELNLPNIPSAVMGAVKPLLVDRAEIDEAHRIFDGSKTVYLIEVNRHGSPDLEVVVSPKGKVISQSEERNRHYRWW